MNDSFASDQGRQSLDQARAGNCYPLGGFKLMIVCAVSVRRRHFQQDHSGEIIPIMQRQVSNRSVWKEYEPDHGQVSPEAGKQNYPGGFTYPLGQLTDSLHWGAQPRKGSIGFQFQCCKRHQFQSETTSLGLNCSIESLFI